MTAKTAALQDIKDELRAENRTFIPFIVSLNPVMTELVNRQLKRQGMKRIPSRNRGQLIAHCLCIANKVKYTNYQKYYEKK